MIVVSGDEFEIGTTFYNPTTESFASGSVLYDVLSFSGDVYLPGVFTVTGVVVSSGGFMYVLPDGAANNTADGGQLLVTGGTANDTTVNSGGFVVVSSGGTANDTTVNSGGDEQVSSGGKASDAKVNSGGSASVTGTASDTTVNGGYLTVSESGVASGTTVTSSGLVSVNFDGTASDTTVDNGGSEVVENFSTATDTTVNSGGYVLLAALGTASDTVVNAGYLSVLGGITSDTTVSSGGFEVVSFGVASDTTVSEGGTEIIYFGGSESDTTFTLDGTVVLSGGTLNATELTIDLDGIVSGYGTISGTDISDDGAIVAQSGTLALDAPVDGSGTLVVGSDSDLVLSGSVGSGLNVSFQDDTGTLTIGDLSDFSGTIGNFVSGDTIDLPGITLDDAEFDRDTGTLSVEQVALGGSVSFEGQIPFLGDYSSDDFSLSDDGQGGTEITIGVPTPSVLTLAELSNAVYDAGTSWGDYEVLNGSVGDTNGFLAEAFINGDQIVIAIRGTDVDNRFNAFKNALADVSFVTGVPDAALTSEVQQAASFLNGIRQAHPNAHITLTGHSLGGAIAQLLGAASGYRTVTFNAPGAALLLPSLQSTLGPAYSASYGLAESRMNYRVVGDQVSLAGQQLSPVTTLQDGNPIDWMHALYGHYMTTVLSLLQSNAPETPGVPDSPLTSLINGVVTTSFNYFVGTFLFNVRDAFVQQWIDPLGANTYTLTEDTGSPQIASITLPVVAGVADYSVSTYDGSTWSTTPDASPGVTESFQAPCRWNPVYCTLTASRRMLL